MTSVPKPPWKNEKKLVISKRELKMNIVRLSTAGSVDDGKSTLIGRLLYDTRSLPKDKIENIEKISHQRGLDEPDLSLITDGLTAEREQGITIDVAHIYFNTPNRKYIVADTPGHVEYTRNMITGASNSDVFIILIDARKGIVEQTKRHLFIASLMEIREVVFVINKIDLMGYEEKVYLEILAGIQKLKNKFKLDGKNLTFIPISAKYGDNVAGRSAHMNWYSGGTLLDYLENLTIEPEKETKARFNVQYVIRPYSDDFHAGKVKSGAFEVGQEVAVLSTGQTSRIKAIHRYKEPLLTAEKDNSVVIELETDIDISRGDILTPANEQLSGDRSIQSRLCWLGKEELSVGRKYLLQYGSTVVPVKVAAVNSQVNFNSSDETGINFESDPEKVTMNSINEVEIRSAAPVYLDLYGENPSNGAFILIDEALNTTVGVGFKE